MNPQYPIYIVSKGRADTRLTAKALEGMGVAYFIVVEKEEIEQYAGVIDSRQILVLPQSFHDEYNPCTDEPHSSNGPGAARNFCWQHSIDLGATSHWVMDDNIKNFGRMNNNVYQIVSSGTILRCAEDFVDRYDNVAISGLQYHMFRYGKFKRPPFVINTRIYSCLLIRNDIRYRWRGRYNEDTDLSLRVLKDGWCTIQFNAFIQNKSTTQTLRGGNTKEFYDKEGTFKKSKMLVEMHPDVAKMTWRYGRWHHKVDYRPFKRNKLIRNPNITIAPGVDNYGMAFSYVDP